MPEFFNRARKNLPSGSTTKPVKTSYNWFGFLACNQSHLQTSDNQITFREFSRSDQVSAGIDQFDSAHLSKLEGLWLLVSISPSNPVITVAGDRFGGIPIYAYQDSSNLVLSTRVAAVHTIFPAQTPISFARLAGFLSSGLPPYFTEKTFFANVRKLKPGTGHIFNLKTGNTDNQSYYIEENKRRLWQFPSQKDIQHCASQLRHRISEAVSKAVEDSKDLALKLSGGLDSSIVAAELSLQGIPFTPFTVTYPECRGVGPDESSLTRLTAKRFGLDVHWIELDGRNMLEDVDKWIACYGMPLSTPGILVDWEADKAIKSQGYQSVASGYVGDTLLGSLDGLWLGELFLVNPFRALRIWYKWFPSIPVSSFLSGTMTFLSSTTHQIIKNLRNRKYAQAAWLRIDPQIPDWYSCKGRHYGEYHLQHGIDEILSLVLDWEYQRVSDLRLKPIIPFLDLKLLHTSLLFPVNYITMEGISKYLGRLAYKDTLPREVVFNKRKLGFDLPIDNWTAGVWSKEILCSINYSNLLEEIVDVKFLADDFNNLSARLKWILYTASRFLDLFG